MSDKEPCAQYMDYLIRKQFTEGSFVTTFSNMMVGESVDLVGRPDEEFPRMEYLITKIKWDGYIDIERMQNQAFRFQINSYIRRPEEAYTQEDMFTAIRWAREIKRIVSMAHIDRIAGNLPCDGFIQMDGFPEVFINEELFPQITSILFAAEVEITLIDTYTNN